jgi:hypothetical protein
MSRQILKIYRILINLIFPKVSEKPLGGIFFSETVFVIQFHEFFSEMDERIFKIPNDSGGAEMLNIDIPGLHQKKI